MIYLIRHEKQASNHVDKDSIDIVTAQLPALFGLKIDLL